MNHFIPSGAFHPINQLLLRRENTLDRIIASLTIIDVKEERYFRQLVQEIKRNIVLRPIVFGQPRLVHVHKEENVSLLRRIFIGVHDLFAKVICFPFTGSRELFKYAPGSLLLPSLTNGIFEPGEDCLLVDVNLPFQDTEHLIEEASAMVRLTQDLIATNNAIVSPWTSQINARIDKELPEKRQELLELYGLR